MSPLPQDVSEYDKQVGQNLSRVRSEKGISRTTLSDATGLQLQTIEDYENGRSQVALDALIKISRCLAVPMSVLFDGMDMALPKSEKAPSHLLGSESAKLGAAGVVLTGEEIQASINLIRQQMGSKVADRITDLIAKASNT